MRRDVDARNRATSAKEVRNFLAHDFKRYDAYLSRGGARITTWMGDELMRVTHKTVSRRRGFYGVPYTMVYVQAIDALGRRWSGRGPGESMYMRLRRVKG